MRLLLSGNSKTFSEQRILLELQANRQVFNRVKDDSSSLFVLRDEASSSSRLTRSTDASSILSRIFPGLDAQLMGTLVYQRAVRSLFRRMTGRKGSPKPSNNTRLTLPRREVQESKDRNRRSEAIDRSLSYDKNTAKREVKIAVLGSSEVLLRSIFSHFPTQDDNFKLETSEAEYTSQIRSATLESIQDLLRHFGDHMSEPYASYATTCQRQMLPVNSIPGNLALAMEETWHFLSKIYHQKDLEKCVLPRPIRLVTPMYCFEQKPEIT